MDAIAAYSKVQQQTHDALVREHVPLVKRIAWHLMGRLPDSVQVDDLIQAGMLGLLEAARNYDSSKGASFETYAGIRIRGCMLDEVRRNDWVPRSVYKNSRSVAEAVRKVEHRLGRDARDTEVAAEMNLSLNDYHALLQDSIGIKLFTLEDLGVSEDAVSFVDEQSSEPQREVLQERLMQQLAEVIDKLPEKEKLVLSLYYEQDLNLKEIGAIIDVSESRVSQILSQATQRIKARMAD